MTTSALPASWTAVLRELGFDLDTVATPSGEEHEWNRLMATFERRGFLMLWAREQADMVQVRIEVALPAHAPSDAVQTSIEERLAQLNATHTEVSTQGPPHIMYTRASSSISEDDIRQLGMMFLKLSDYIHAVEDDHDTALPFGASAESKSVGGAAFESIGTSAPDAPESDNAQRASSSTPSGAFETIGRGEPESTTDQTIHLKDFKVSAPSPNIEICITLDVHPDASTRRILARGLKQALEVRFDVQVQDNKQVDGDEMMFHVQSASSSYPLGKRDRADMESFFERLVKFGALGMDLFGALNLNTQGELTPSTRARREYDTLTAMPRQTKTSGNRPADLSSAKDTSKDSSEVVLSFEHVDAPEQNAPLEPQRYDDERLNRPDATTPLVDIILRHPGFSDRRIGQVLSILLSIDTVQAKNLIVQAPCPISWGVSRERALTFKSAMEGAGAKALLVEPGTFKTR